LPVLRRLLLRQAMLQLSLRLRRLLQRELADRDVRLLGRLLSVLPA